SWSEGYGISLNGDIPAHSGEHASRDSRAVLGRRLWLLGGRSEIARDDFVACGVCPAERFGVRAHSGIGADRQPHRTSEFPLYVQLLRSGTKPGRASRLRARVDDD